MLWDIVCPTRPTRVPMAGFRDRGIAPPSLRMIPHPSVTLFLFFGGTLAVEDSTGRRQSGSFVAGLGFGDLLRVNWSPHAECLQLRLSPLAAYSLLGGAVAELGTTVWTLDDLWGREASRISEQLADLPNWDARFAWADAWLTRTLATPATPELAWAWHQIVASRGTVRMEHLAAELGWSRKRLWSRFQSQLCLPPKRAAKLVRFDHAVHRLVAGQNPAAAAADGGYADQSHLHRDVMAYTSLTPTAVVNEPFLAIDDVAWGWPTTL